MTAALSASNERRHRATSFPSYALRCSFVAPRVTFSESGVGGTVQCGHGGDWPRGQQMLGLPAQAKELPVVSPCTGAGSAGLKGGSAS